MAAFSKEDLVSYLEGLGITLQIYEHPAVMTAEEHAKHIGHLEGAQSKNLLLKDKRGRLYLVSALPSTAVDLKVLSQRLGLGKGGLRMAPEESLQEVLKVPLGSVTPLSLINESSKSVVLLLDQNFRAYPRLFFHPLTNDSTVAITTAGLEIFLKSINREPAYVDLEAVVPVGKDHPPDLTTYVQTDVAVEPDAKKGNSVVNNDGITTGAHIKKKANEKDAQGACVNLKQVSHKSTLGELFKSVLHDPQVLANYILDEALGRVLLKVKSELGNQMDITVASSVLSEVKQQFSPDLENIIVLFKNTAYTEGFTSAMACQKSLNS